MLALLLAGPASGAILTWDGSSGNWDTDASWLPGGSEPTSTDDVVINAGTVDVTLAGEVTGDLSLGTAMLNFSGGDLTASGLTTINTGGTVTQASGPFNANGGVLIDGGSYTRSAGSFNLASGQNMTVQNGGLFQWDGDNLILDDAGTSVLVTGSGSTLRRRDFVSFDNTLYVDNGVQVNATLGGDIVADYLSLNDGAMTLDGVGSQLALTTGLNPGLAHQVGNGLGQVASLTFSDNATGSFVSIDPATLFVGRNDGTGTIDVLTGAELTLQDFNIAAENGTGSAIVRVNGAGSDITQIEGYNLDIGLASGTTGTLNVENGGVYNASYVGTLNINATGTLNANGGTFNVLPRNSMTNQVGKAGGTLTTGGTVTISSAAVLVIGGRGGHGNMMTSSGATGGVGGSFVVAGGSVTVSGTGVLSTQGGAGGFAPTGKPGGLGGDGGTIAVHSGVLTLNDGLISTAGGAGGIGGTGAEDGAQGAHGTINITGGTFNLNGGEVITGTIEHPGTGAFNFNGGTLSVDTFLGTLTQDGGTLTPGSSPGITTVSGNYNLSTGTLAIELGGLAAGSESDQIDVTGALNLGLSSVLDVMLIDAFSPASGDSFDILDFGSITGSFGTINLPTLGANLDWNISNLLIDGTLSVYTAAGIGGDLNADGFVGVDDLNIVLVNWNQNVTPGDLLSGDPDGSGFVGVDDLNVVLVNWNSGTPPADGGAIPEPASLALLGLGGLALMRRRTAC